VPLHYGAPRPVNFFSPQTLLRAMKDAGVRRGRWTLLKRAWKDPVLRHRRWRLLLSVLTRIWENFRQSKLSQQELAELQKATHFDKKELQQWYKGLPDSPFSIAYIPPALVGRICQTLTVSF
jgi:hypothetical protein